MNTHDFNRYSYYELRAKATAPDAEQIDIDTLGEWFAFYGSDYWNGEYYDADGLRLFPVVVWNENTEQGEIERYEFR